MVLIKFNIKKLYAYTTEYYPTLIRGLGTGVASSLARISTFLMPFVVMPVYESSNMLPFLLFSIISLLSVM